MYEIVIGRTESDRKELGLKGTIFIGKHFVKMGATTSLSNKVFMDVSRSHVILVCGKRGSGKSYTLGVIAEEICNLDADIKDNIAIFIFDTMGIYWTMKYPNVKDEDLLDAWELKAQKLDIDIYTPAGFYQEHKEKGIPTDYEFTIQPKELTAADWALTLGINLTDPIGVLIERVLEKLEDTNYSIDDIIKTIQEDKRIKDDIKIAAENRFIAVKHWGLFSTKGTMIKDLIKGGKTTVLDISCYTGVSGNWGIKNLVIGLVSRKLMMERMKSRKAEELADVESGHSYFSTQKAKAKNQKPLAWLLLDEAHEALPKEGKTPATDALVQILREGRQPGVSLILATQQPGEIHKDVMTQSDVVISHRITAKKDITALNSIMQTYLASDIMKYLNNLPRLKGSAIILDDNSERMYPLRIKPRFTWHGGEAPTLVKAKGKAAKELLI